MSKKQNSFHPRVKKKNNYEWHSHTDNLSENHRLHILIIIPLLTIDYLVLEYFLYVILSLNIMFTISLFLIHEIQIITHLHDMSSCETCTAHVPFGDPCLKRPLIILVN